MQDFIQKELQGRPYIISCNGGKLITPIEDQEVAIKQFFATVGTEKGDAVIIGSDGKLIFANNQAEQNQSESLNEGGDEQNLEDYCLDGALFLEVSDAQKKLLMSAKDKQSREAILRGMKSKNWFIQFDEAIKLFCADEQGEPVGIEFLAVKRLTWNKSEVVRAGLEHGKGKDERAVGLPWQISEIKQLNEYLDMDEPGKKTLIHSLKCLELEKFLLKFYELQFSGFSYDVLIELLIFRLTNASPEDLEFFLKEMGSWPEYIDVAVREGLLRDAPEFYESFAVQEDRLISEEQLNEHIVIREYCRDNFDECTDFELYDFEKKK